MGNLVRPLFQPQEVEAAPAITRGYSHGDLRKVSLLETLSGMPTILSEQGLAETSALIRTNPGNAANFCVARQH
jgi:hypothetical protein